MSRSILVTGGTGTLGRAVVTRLSATMHDVRVLSRSTAPTGPAARGWFRGDLRTGAGLDEALAHADVILHCATTGGRADVAATRRLIAAAADGGRPRLVYVSIVGCDRIPLRYYRAKQECERLIESSGLPWTIVRVTQFHDLIAAFFTAQRRLPAVLVPSGVSFQPIDVRDVADRLAEIIGRVSVGREPDIGGPEISTAAELARTYRGAVGGRRAVLPISLPGRVLRGLRRGGNLVPGNAVGQRTFGEFLAQAPAGSR
ncbi:uncharacterized protein YbjT (DUF2867 family) [Actinoalloteichus hoggarensis]|uniref:Uncharacterized protein n=1 Tax=Actinoalloteichus hoggarensis TaxID=1470176 RepID=A0A221VXT6_9PSEU|nr:SDR family oxidoreductase [Actinoalloteichus hoggarensis]ASO18287.1 hypothetical protein AHOG_03145 [Actinoalloteichus hoggarensis]MBB5921649.1 uncharacterized protein YbjT (DUF2867 family) [Actinoalloteichus hoggarensis]